MTKYNVTPTISKIVSNFEDTYQIKTSREATSDNLKNEDIFPSESISCFIKIIRSFRLELLAFLLAFSLMLPRISLTSLVLEKVCLAHFKHPKHICDHLENYTDLKPPIEKLANNYQLGYSLIQMIPSSILGCFMGPWSDQYGRKLPVFLAVAGMTIDQIGCAICAYFMDSRVEYLYIGVIFYGISGGSIALITTTYSFVCDLVAYEKRTAQYAYIEVTSGISLPIGALAGGWIFNFLGYYPVFLVSAAGLIATLLVVVFILPETRGLDVDESWLFKFKALFSCKTFKESFIATAKERPNKGRKQIVLLILSSCFFMASLASTTDINYLYVHHQFNWKNTVYSTISAIYSIIGIIVLGVFVPFFKRIKITDPILGIIGSTSLLIKYLGIGLAFNEYIYHIASVLGVLSACAQLAARSRISKVISNDDIGKVFAFVAITESLFPLITTVILSQIFNAFLTTFAGMPYIFLAILLTFPFAVFIWLTRLPDPTYEEINGTNDHQKEKYVKVEPEENGY